MTVAEIALTPEPCQGEEERVFLWRVECLCRAGFTLRTACRLAESRDVDLHVAVELVDRGCAPATAARILL